MYEKHRCLKGTSNLKLNTPPAFRTVFNGEVLAKPAKLLNWRDINIQMDIDNRAKSKIAIGYTSALYFGPVLEADISLSIKMWFINDFVHELCLSKQKAKIMDTCNNGEDCKNGGRCEKKGGYKFCSCKLGVIGDYCETVFDCTPNGKYKNCENSGGKCFYFANRAECECPRNEKLNDKKFICEASLCRGGEIVEEEGKKRCKCPPGYGNFTNFSCRACDCGPETSCIWEARFGGNKICLCKPGYSTKKGKCVACECGSDSECEWISEGWLKPDRKVCHCKPGYREENGKCVDKQDIGKS